MKKRILYFLCIVAVVCLFLFAGWCIKDPYVTGMQAAGVGAIGFIFLGVFVGMTTDFHDDNNAESIILKILDPRRGYEVIQQVRVGGAPFQVLVELDTKRRRYSSVDFQTSVGFQEVEDKGETFWIPSGKKLIRGTAADYIFAPNGKEGN